MMGIIGLVLGAGGGWLAWWAFSRGGDDPYSWIRPVALIVCILGISLLFIFLRKWWIAD